MATQGLALVAMTFVGDIWVLLAVGVIYGLGDGVLGR